MKHYIYFPGNHNQPKNKLQKALIPHLEALHGTVTGDVGGTAKKLKGLAKRLSFVHHRCASLEVYKWKTETGRSMGFSRDWTCHIHFYAIKENENQPVKTKA